MQAYDKPPINLLLQLSLLQDRGLHIADETAALRKIAVVSYFRLSAYWYPYRQLSLNGDRLDEFIPGSNFQKITELYDFDRELRSLILEAIEQVEITVRAQIAYHFSQAYGVFGHADASNFHRKFEHTAWHEKLESETLRSKDKFIQHYRSNYTGFPRLPVWMATEIMSLGTISFFYKGMNMRDKQEISQFFDLPYKEFGSWLHTLTYVRNLSAHHSRLWNRKLAIHPGRMNGENWLPPITPKSDRLFYILLMLRQLLKAIDGGEEWRDRISVLITPFAQDPKQRESMGIPEQWESHPLWQ